MRSRISFNIALAIVMMTNLGCTQETTSDTNALNNTEVSEQSGASLVSPLPASISQDTEISAKSLTEEDLALMNSDQEAAIKAKLERWKKYQESQGNNQNVPAKGSTNDELLTEDFINSYPVAIPRPTRPTQQEAVNTNPAPSKPVVTPTPVITTPKPVTTPVVVVPRPTTQAPVVEKPVTQPPVAETPVVETPVVETPVVETPVVETPVAETPVVETPVVETPVDETPATEGTPVTGGTESPSTDEEEVAFEAQDFVTWRASALPNVTFGTNGYRAILLNNPNNATLHFNQDQGRFDGALTRFPFEVIVRNVGVESYEVLGTAPLANPEAYVFAGVQIHVLDGNEPTSSHVVVGHRGSHPFTIEGKNTVNGQSAVDDIGENAVPSAKADLRIVGNADHTLTVYWQQPNLNPDSVADKWKLYQGSGKLPGKAPSYGDEVYVGLITYAYDNISVPLIGKADSFDITEY